MIIGLSLGGTITAYLPTRCDFAILALCALPAIALALATPERLRPSKKEVDGDVAQDGAPSSVHFLADVAEGVQPVLFGASAATALIGLCFVAYTRHRGV